MTRIPARPEGYGYEYVPAMDSPRGKTEPNWRVSDPRDNRIATCYDEENCRLIVAALNGVTVQFVREGSIESDPYAVGRYSFADLVHDCHALDRDADLSETVVLRVRDRVFDDVHASHRMLDALGIAGGTLTARIGLALGWKVLEREKREVMERSASVPRPRGASPLVDVDSAKVPDPEVLFAVLDQLSGEELFRLFDAVKVLPPNTREARPWDLMNLGDVRDMTRECCQIAFDAGRLAELAKAAGEMTERKGGR